MRRRRRWTDGGAVARVPLAARAGALCAAAVWSGCNAILGIEPPVRESATTAADAGSGSAGAGGDRPECRVLEVSPEEPLELSLIDDMEDGNIGILRGDDANPRQGAWYKYNDGSEEGVHEPLDAADLIEAMMPARRDSAMAVHTSGNALFTNWGAGIGFELSTSYYDATGYRGITFWARAEDDSATGMFVTFVDQQTDNAGGICGTMAGQVPCYDHYNTSVTLTSDWKHFKVPVECLKQEGYGRFEALAQDRLGAIQFSFGRGQAFDFWIDDVAFYR
ncbi:hypothetical protein [Sorangium sp. So ce1097]|uniref:hypothetical protein n=1 Tax=Sorangium sp. So ce1097 TaxID=3133330 RepID=UPI003F5F6C71